MVKPVCVIAITFLNMVVMISSLNIVIAFIFSLIPLVHLHNLPHLHSGHGDAIKIVLQGVLNIQFSSNQNKGPIVLFKHYIQCFRN